MNAIFETLDTRMLLSAAPTPTFTAGAPEPTALLVPAVQKVREAAARSSSASPAGGILVGLADGSVRFCDGSVRFVGEGINATIWT